MPPIVRLAIWFRLIGTTWWCPSCGMTMIGGYGAQHIVNTHPWDMRSKRSWVDWFDSNVATLWL